MTVTQLPLELADKHGNPFRVRELEAGDRAELEQMYAAFMPKRAAQGLPPEGDYALRRWLDHIMKGGRHFLVEVGAVVSGHLMLIPMEDGESIELAVFLHQSIRRRGIGTAMNRLAVQLAREDGFKRVWLSVELSNIPAIRSYQKAGFKTLKETVWAAEVEMEVRL
ncbi:MAG TPA: GNAT family N-acetyltransferase [Longimicrobiales bacterium]